jgi:hypothetical protein
MQFPFFILRSDHAQTSHCFSRAVVNSIDVANRDQAGCETRGEEASGRGHLRSAYRDY